MTARPSTAAPTSTSKKQPLPTAVPPDEVLIHTQRGLKYKNSCSWLEAAQEFTLALQLAISQHSNPADVPEICLHLTEVNLESHSLTHARKHIGIFDSFGQNQFTQPHFLRAGYLRGRLSILETQGVIGEILHSRAAIQPPATYPLDYLRGLRDELRSFEMQRAQMDWVLRRHAFEGLHKGFFVGATGESGEKIEDEDLVNIREAYVNTGKLTCIQCHDSFTIEAEQLSTADQPICDDCYSNAPIRVVSPHPVGMSSASSSPTLAPVKLAAGQLGAPSSSLSLHPPNPHPAAAHVHQHSPNHGHHAPANNHQYDATYLPVPAKDQLHHHSPHSHHPHVEQHHHHHSEPAHMISNPPSGLLGGHHEPHHDPHAHLQPSNQQPQQTGGQHTKQSASIHIKMPQPHNVSVSHNLPSNNNNNPPIAHTMSLTSYPLPVYDKAISTSQESISSFHFARTESPFRVGDHDDGGSEAGDISVVEIEGGGNAGSPRHQLHQHQLQQQQQQQQHPPTAQHSPPSRTMQPVNPYGSPQQSQQQQQNQPPRQSPPRSAWGNNNAVGGGNAAGNNNGAGKNVGKTLHTHQPSISLSPTPVQTSSGSPLKPHQLAHHALLIEQTMGQSEGYFAEMIGDSMKSGASGGFGQTMSQTMMGSPGSSPSSGGGNSSSSFQTNNAGSPTQSTTSLPQRNHPVAKQAKEREMTRYMEQTMKIQMNGNTLHQKNQSSVSVWSATNMVGAGGASYQGTMTLNNNNNNAASANALTNTTSNASNSSSSSSSDAPPLRSALRRPSLVSVAGAVPISAPSKSPPSSGGQGNLTSTVKGGSVNNIKQTMNPAVASSANATTATPPPSSAQSSSTYTRPGIFVGFHTKQVHSANIYWIRPDGSKAHLTVNENLFKIGRDRLTEGCDLEVTLQNDPKTKREKVVAITLPNANAASAAAAKLGSPTTSPISSPSSSSTGARVGATMSQQKNVSFSSPQASPPSTSTVTPIITSSPSSASSSIRPGVFQSFQNKGQHTCNIVCTSPDGAKTPYIVRFDKFVSCTRSQLTEGVALEVTFKKEADGGEKPIAVKLATVSVNSNTPATTASSPPASSSSSSASPPPPIITSPSLIGDSLPLKSDQLFRNQLPTMKKITEEMTPSSHSGHHHGGSSASSVGGSMSSIGGSLVNSARSLFGGTNNNNNNTATKTTPLVQFDKNSLKNTASAGSIGTSSFSAASSATAAASSSSQSANNQTKPNIQNTGGNGKKQNNGGKK